MKNGKKLRQPISRGVANVPVIMQMEALECGAACLAMVLAYYGKWISLEQVRTDCGVSAMALTQETCSGLRAAMGLRPRATAMKQKPAPKGDFPLHSTLELQPFCGTGRLQRQKSVSLRPGKGKLFCADRGV